MQPTHTIVPALSTSTGCEKGREAEMTGGCVCHSWRAGLAAASSTAVRERSCEMGPGRQR